MTIIMENVQAVKVMSLNIGSLLMLPLKPENSGFFDVRAPFVWLKI